MILNSNVYAGHFPEKESFSDVREMVMAGEGAFTAEGDWFHMLSCL